MVISLLSQSHATFVTCDDVDADLGYGHHGPEPVSEQLPDLINTLPPIPRYPSCDWTKNNKDNDARNNDERLEQRNWEPRGGSGAGLWYNARWIRALAPISRPGHFRFDGLQSLDTHLHTVILYIRQRIKDKHHEIICHISDHRWWAVINSPNYRAKDHQFSIMQYTVTDVDLVFWPGDKEHKCAIKTALRGNIICLST